MNLTRTQKILLAIVALILILVGIGTPVGYFVTLHAVNDEIHKEKSLNNATESSTILNFTMNPITKTTEFVILKSCVKFQNAQDAANF